MSGGSYNYLCHKDERDLLGGWSEEEDLRHMADRLAGLGYAEDAARETEELICMLRQSRIRIETRVQRLRDVWKAVEWWDSCDWQEKGVHEALSAYRGETDSSESSQ